MVSLWFVSVAVVMYLPRKFVGEGWGSEVLYMVVILSWKKPARLLHSSCEGVMLFSVAAGLEKYLTMLKSSLVLFALVSMCAASAVFFVGLSRQW